MYKQDIKKRKITKWHHVYFLLALIDIVAVGLSLSINRNIMEIYEESTVQNQEWADRLAKIGRLNELVTLLNGPGNNVFHTGDVNNERRTLDKYSAEFTEEYLNTIRDLEQNVAVEIGSPIITHLHQANDSIYNLAQRALLIFYYIDSDDIPKAGNYMVSMDRAYADASLNLIHAASIVRDIQKQHLNDQVQAASDLSQFEYVIAGLMGLMIICVLFYGRYLSSRMYDYEEEQQGNMERLKQSEAFNRSILDNTLDAIISVDHKGIIQSVNESTRDIFGYAPDELLNQNIAILMPDIYARKHDKYLETYQKTGVAKIIGTGRELIARRKDGSEFPIDLELSEIKNKSKPIYIGVVRDITEQKENMLKLVKALEAADQAARAKSNFLATMSHEIRTPMNGVLGMAEILRNTELTEEQMGYLNTLTQSGKSLLTVINDILDFSKVESGNMKLELISFNLEEIVHDVCTLLNPVACEKGLEIILDYESDCLTHFRADPGRIRQVLMNLIGNAIKFTEEGYVLVHVLRKKTTDSTTNIEIRVTDTGIGISQEAQINLFNAFTQADSTTTRRFGGTGLGLSICKQLIELMSGEINLESNPGIGSTFYFELPLENSTPLDAYPRADLNKVSVLIVDDNVINCRVLSKQLAGLGMQVDIVYNVTDALALLKQRASEQNPFELVITDYLMPEEDGIVLARRIKADENLKTTPLILYSSAAVKGDTHRFEKEGFQGYITKPLFSDVLYDVLASVVGVNKAGLKEDTIITRHSVKERKTPVEAPTLKARVLLVEDNIINQKVSQAMLLKIGLEIDIADNGEIATRMVKEKHYDIVLMDIQMPVMDGIEATKIIRSYVECKELPIIALTANVMPEDRENYFRNGMNDFIPKPFNKDEFISVLKKWIHPVKRNASSIVYK